MKHILYIAVSLALFLSCRKADISYGEASYYFKESQPKYMQKLTKFPKVFRGVYNVENGTKLFIGQKVMYYEHRFKKTVSKALIDSLGKDAIYKDNKLIIKDFNVVYDVKEIGDSLHLTSIVKDTVFQFRNMENIKNNNNYLFINTNDDNKGWLISMLSIKNDSLNWKYISEKKDFKLLESIVKDIYANPDTTIVNLNPTGSELNEILSNSTIGWIKKYKKINTRYYKP